MQKVRGLELKLHYFMANLPQGIVLILSMRKVKAVSHEIHIQVKIFLIPKAIFLTTLLSFVGTSLAKPEITGEV